MRTACARCSTTWSPTPSATRRRVAKSQSVPGWLPTTAVCVYLNETANNGAGRWEVSAKLPSGVGTWPAIWLLYADGFYGNGSWPDNGEIDIMEHVGFDPGRVHATLHNDLRFGDNGHSASTQVPTVESEFHTYSMEWSPELFEFFIRHPRNAFRPTAGSIHNGAGVSDAQR